MDGWIDRLGDDWSREWEVLFFGSFIGWLLLVAQNQMSSRTIEETAARSTPIERAYGESMIATEMICYCIVTHSLSIVIH